MRYTIFTLFLLFSSLSFAAKPTVTIGVTIPLSGDLAAYGEDIKNGFLLAKEQIKDTKYNYEFIFEDDQLQTSKTVLNTQKLINVNKADIVVTMWDASKAIAPIGDQKNTVILAYDWNSDAVNSFKNLVLFCVMNNDFCQKTLEFLKIKKVKSAAFIVDNMGFSTLFQVLKPLNKDLEITPYFYDSTQRDFRSILTKASATKPDMIVVWGTDPSRTLIIQQAKQVIPNVPLTGIFDAIPDAKLVEGVPFVSELPLTTSFNEKYFNRFKKKPVMYSPFAYDTVHLLVSVFEKNSGKKLKGKELKDAILRETSFVGACGKVDMTPTGLIKLNPNIQVFKNGKPVSAQYMNNLFF